MNLSAVVEVLVYLNPLPFTSMQDQVVAHHLEACESMLQLQVKACESMQQFIW